MDWKSAISGFASYLLLERSLSKHSIDAYVRDVQKLHQFLALSDTSATPPHVAFSHLESFVHWIHDLGLGARSQARILSGIRAFFKYLLIEDVIQDDPSELLEGPKTARKIPEILSVTEIERMLETIDVSHPKKGHRDRAMLETLYACGLRVTELITLKLSNVYEDLGVIKVIGKNNKERIIPIGPAAVRQVSLYRSNARRLVSRLHKDGQDVLFLNLRGRALSRIAVFQLIKKAARDAGISKNVSPHTFRHSFATHLVEGGADLKAVQDMLGHESITTTEIYTHLDTDYLKETILQFHPRNRQRNEASFVINT